MSDARIVILRVATAVELEAAYLGGGKFTEVTGVEKPDGWPEKIEMFRYAIGRLKSNPEEARWRIYFFLDESGRLIGSGGYHGPPDDSGCVEIGYEIAPAFQSQGFGSSAVAELLAHAFSDEQVQVVTAKTKPELNPSVKILRRAKFYNKGPVYDAAYDETQWAWGLPRPVYEESREQAAK